jgi:hypothetical protein
MLPWRAELAHDRNGCDCHIYQGRSYSAGTIQTRPRAHLAFAPDAMTYPDWGCIGNVAFGAEVNSLDEIIIEVEKNPSAGMISCRTGYHLRFPVRDIRPTNLALYTIGSLTVKLAQLMKNGWCD